MAMKVFKGITCPVCGMACDDIEVWYDEEKQEIIVKNACREGAPKFKELVSPHRIREPMIKKNGEFVKVSWEEAIEKAAEILANAKRPLLFMGAETSAEAHIVGLHMAEYLGGVVDSNSTI
jgi:formylmethanofuran dehydrogenase subunit B